MISKTFNLLPPLLVLACIWSFTSLHATHIVGGEMSYLHNGNGEYLVTLKIYRDCGPDNVNNTGFDDIAYIGVYENDNLYTTLNILLADAEISEIPATIDNPCLVAPEVCIEEAIYTTTVTLPSNATGYDLVYVRCCRSPAIVNLTAPQDQGMTCSTHIPGTNEISGFNSSASFAALPPALFCGGEPFTMNHAAVDPDGDSLVYELCWPLHGATPDVPQPMPEVVWIPLNVTWMDPYSSSYPIASSPMFNINYSTGVFSGTPTMPGKWVFAICVSEYREGILINTVRRDYMIQVLDCAPVTVASIPFIEPCQGMDIEFTNSSINSTDYLWDFGVDGLESDTSHLVTPVYEYADTGLYVITLIAQPGLECADTATIQLPVFEPLEGTLNLTDSWCSDGAMYFDFNFTGNQTSGAEFTWDFPANSSPATSSFPDPPAFALSTPGGHVVELDMTDHFCEFSGNANIDVPVLPQAEIIPLGDPCPGLTINFQANIQNANSVTWNFGAPGTDDVSNEFQPSYTYPSYGIYTVTLTAEAETGCSSVSEMAVEVNPANPLVMNYSSFMPVPCGTDTSVVVQFFGTGATSIIWDFGDGTTATENTVHHQYEDEGVYTVNLTIRNDICDTEESVDFEIFFEKEIADLELIMPNIFTPNGDSKNEGFRVFDPLEKVKLPASRSIFDYIENYSLKIYDRWGILLFENSGNESWDGTYDGDLVNEGTYYYVLSYNEICGGKKHDKAGHVQVNGQN